MSQNLTKPHNEPLNDKQLMAIECLVGGQSVTETAFNVGVERETVSRWKNGHAAFIAAYNQARNDAHETYALKLADLRVVALDYLLDVLGGEESLDRKSRANIALKLVMMAATSPYLEVNPHIIEGEVKRKTAVPIFEFDLF